MKTFNIAAVVSTAVLFAAGVAHAEDSIKSNVYNYNFISKRPYMDVVANNAQKKDAQWEGATFIAGQETFDEANLNNQSKLRLNMLSKRPY